MTSTTITFYGASDDLVEVRGCPGDGEFDAYSDGPRDVSFVALLQAPNMEKATVHAVMLGDGWHLGIGPVDRPVGDDPFPLPSWPVRFRAGDVARREPSHTAVLEVDAPEGTRLTVLRGSR